MKLIDIIKYEYGFNTQEAKKFIKTIDERTKKALYNGFLNNSKKSFYND